MKAIGDMIKEARDLKALISAPPEFYGSDDREVSNYRSILVAHREQLIKLIERHPDCEQTVLNEIGDPEFVSDLHQVKALSKRYDHIREPFDGGTSFGWSLFGMICCGIRKIVEREA